MQNCRVSISIRHRQKKSAAEATLLNTFRSVTISEGSQRSQPDHSLLRAT
jgi:hypothetical protein